VNEAEEFDLPQPAMPAGNDAVEQMRNAMAELESTLARAERLDAELKKARSHADFLRKKVLPELMITVQTSDMTTGGSRFLLEQMVVGGFPKEPAARAAAVRWLEEHDSAGLIKTEVVMEFARSEHNIAADICQTLRDGGYSPVLQSTVHPQTLYAFVKERLRSGKPLSEEDQQTLGVQIFQVVKVKKIGED
jgi:hypothetical protein